MESRGSRDMITRLIPTTTLTVMCVDTRTQAVNNLLIPIVGKNYPPEVVSVDERLEKRLLKVATEKINRKTIKPIKVVKTEVTKQLYGMTPEAFIKHSLLLEKDTRKIALTKEEENENV